MSLKALQEAKKVYKRVTTPAFIQVPVSKAEKEQVQATLGRTEKGLKEDKERGLLNKRTLKATLPGAGIGALLSANLRGSGINRKMPIKEAITKLLSKGKKGIIGGAVVGAAASAAVQLRERVHKKRLIRLMKEELVKREGKFIKFRLPDPNKYPVPDSAKLKPAIHPGPPGMGARAKAAVREKAEKRPKGKAAFKQLKHLLKE